MTTIGKDPTFGECMLNHSRSLFIAIRHIAESEHPNEGVRLSLVHDLASIGHYLDEIALEQIDN